MDDRQHELNILVAELKSQVKNMTQELESLRSIKEQQGDEIRALKGEVRSYLEESKSTNLLHDMPIMDVGKEIRLRYLAKHRLDMEKNISKASRDNLHAYIKAGDRAAHRGRPLADAWLY